MEVELSSRDLLHLGPLFGKFSPPSRPFALSVVARVMDEACAKAWTGLSECPLAHLVLGIKLRLGAEELADMAGNITVGFVGILERLGNLASFEVEVSQVTLQWTKM